MKTTPFDPAHLRDSVFAVPPLARDAQLNASADENKKIIQFLEAGGVRSILYGGNAVFYHTKLSEYDGLLGMLAGSASDETVIVPSIGPAYGLAMDQVDILRDHEFPTVLLLPSRDVVDQAGICKKVAQLRPIGVIKG